MNISSALIKQCIATADFETWSYLRKEYLPVEYHTLYGQIDKHCETFHEFPSFDDLKLSIRHAPTRDKVFAIEAVDVDVDAGALLEYLKNEYTQKEILNSLDNYIDNSVVFSSAEESVQELHQIVLDIEDKVDLEIPQESMQRIELFEPEEEIGKYIGLGLNAEYDHEIKFSPEIWCWSAVVEALVSHSLALTLLTTYFNLDVQLFISRSKWIVDQYCNGVVLSLLECHTLVFEHKI